RLVQVMLLADDRHDAEVGIRAPGLDPGLDGKILARTKVQRRRVRRGHLMARTIKIKSVPDLARDKFHAAQSGQMMIPRAVGPVPLAFPPRDQTGRRRDGPEWLRRQRA